MACGDTTGTVRHLEEVKQVDCLDIVSYKTLHKAHLNRARLDEADKSTQERSAQRIHHTNRVTFNEFLHARDFAKDMNGAGKTLEDDQADLPRSVSTPAHRSELLKRLSDTGEALHWTTTA